MKNKYNNILKRVNAILTKAKRKDVLMIATFTPKDGGKYYLTQTDDTGEKKFSFTTRKEMNDYISRIEEKFEDCTLIKCLPYKINYDSL